LIARKVSWRMEHGMHVRHLLWARCARCWQWKLLFFRETSQMGYRSFQSQITEQGTMHWGNFPRQIFRKDISSCHKKIVSSPVQLIYGNKKIRKKKIISFSTLRTSLLIVLTQ
jgi:hypothetical protein